MAVLAGIARREVSPGLAGGPGAIVTVYTIIDNACMVKNSDGPGLIHMAAFAIVARLDVVERLAGSMQLVMASCTRQRRMRVVET